jgi:glycosyltransferase involved in cell wall biosynthesis
MKAPPRISLVTPSFNQAPFLEQTLRSVLEQGYPNLQYGVVDGGSTDGSTDIIRRFQRQLDYAILEPDHGQSDAINKGLRRADGEIVGWLNSDDTLLPGALTRVGEYFTTHPQCQWLIGCCQETDGQGQPTRLLQPQGTFTLAGALIRRGGFNVPQPATFWHRSIIEHLGFLDPSLHYCMDFEYWCRMLAAGFVPDLTKAVLATYRMHPHSKSCGQPRGFIETLIKIERSYAHDLPWRQQWRLRRLIGYQQRAAAISAASGRPWRQVLRRPWWLGSQQVVSALAGRWGDGGATGRRAEKETGRATKSLSG